MKSKPKIWAIYYKDYYIILKDTDKVHYIIGKDAGRINKVVCMEYNNDEQESWICAYS